MKPKNNTDIKNLNTKAVFEIIQKHKAITRRDLEKLSAASWGSISKFAALFIQKGLVVEEEVLQSGKGRPTKKLCISNSVLILGLDINISGITILVSNLAGTILNQTNINIENNDSESVLAGIFDKTDALIKNHSAVSAIAVSMQGYVDTKKGISISSPHFKNWENIPLKKLFESRYHIPAYIFHDPDCLMAYELFSNGNLSESSNSLLLRVDYGIGMSAILGGTIFSSEHGSACESGHMIVRQNGYECKCGKKGCLEMYFTIPAFTYEYNKAQNKNIKTADYLKLLSESDEAALSALKNNMKYFEMALSNLTSLFAPKTICVGGILINLQEKYFKEYFQSLSDYKSFSQTAIKFIKYENNQAALGAVLQSAALMTDVFLKQ